MGRIFQKFNIFRQRIKHVYLIFLGGVLKTVLLGKHRLELAQTVEKGLNRSDKVGYIRIDS